MIIFLYDVEYDFKMDEELSLEETLKEFYNLSDKDGSFLGIRMENKQIIQFSYESNNMWLVDIPLRSSFDIEQVSLQKYADYDECVSIISNTFYHKDIRGLYKVFVMKEILSEVKSTLNELTQYKMNTEGFENIKEEFTFNGWERGLFIYWAYKNSLLIPQIQKLLDLYLNELENPTHKIFSEVLENSIGDKFELEFYTDENREFILDYIYFSTEEYSFYIDIKDLYPNIKNTDEVPEVEDEYNQIIKILDSRYEEYKKSRE